jgi:chromosomal replication initiation ATPase DnaA
MSEVQANLSNKINIWYPTSSIAAAILSLTELDSRIPLKTIIYIVAAAHDITIEELQGHRRSHYLVLGRFHVVDMVSKHRPDVSEAELARRLNRDRSSIRNAREKWPSAQFEVNQDVIAEVNRAISKIAQSSR